MHVIRCFFFTWVFIVKLQFVGIIGYVTRLVITSFICVFFFLNICCLALAVWQKYILWNWMGTQFKFEQIVLYAWAHEDWREVLNICYCQSGESGRTKKWKICNIQDKMAKLSRIDVHIDFIVDVFRHQYAICKEYLKMFNVQCSFHSIPFRFVSVGYRYGQSWILHNKFHNTAFGSQVYSQFDNKCMWISETRATENYFVEIQRIKATRSIPIKQSDVVIVRCSLVIFHMKIEQSHIHTHEINF